LYIADKQEQGGRCKKGVGVVRDREIKMKGVVTVKDLAESSRAHFFVFLYLKEVAKKEKIRPSFEIRPAFQRDAAYYIQW
jgi:hypothetical protein